MSEAETRAELIKPELKESGLLAKGLQPSQFSSS